MIKSTRQYRMPDINDLPVFNQKDDGLPVFTPKKKEDFPLLYGRSKTGSVPAILPSRVQLKSEESNPTVTKEFANEFASKRQKAEATDSDIEQDVAADASNSLQNYEGDDPLGNVLKSSRSVQYLNPDGTPDDRANIKAFTKKLEMLENAFESGDKARLLLQKDVFGKSIDDIPIEEVKKLAGGNITKQYAANRYEKLRNVEKALKEGNTLEEAAIKYAANTDENVKFLLDKTNGHLGGFTESTSAIPLAMRGEKMLQFLLNPDLLHIANNNQDLARNVREEIANFPLRHPEYATRFLADKIAKKRDEKGLNNYFLNIVGKDATDEIVNELIESGELPFNYKKIYEENIRPKLGTANSVGRGIGNTLGFGQLVNDAPIKTPGLVENVGEGWERTYRGAAKSIANLPEIVGLPGVQDLIQTEGQQQYNVLKDVYEQSQYEPESLIGKTAMHGGQMGGFVLGLLGGGGALKATNIIKNPAAASTAMMVLGTHSDNADKAKILFPRNDFKQFVYTATMDALNAAMGKFLPGHQLPKLLKGGEEKVATTLKKMIDGSITTDAAKNSIMTWFANTAKGSLKGGEFMGAIGAADNLLTQTLQGKDIDFGETREAAWDGFKMGLLATAPMAAFEGALKSNKGMRGVVMDVAKNPEYYKQVLQRESEIDTELSKSKEDILNNIDFISGVYKEVQGTSVKDKERYIMNSLSEKIKLDKAEATTDPTLKKKLQKESKDLNEIKLNELKGVPEEKTRLNQAIKEVKEFYDEGFLSKGSMEMLESVEGEGGKPKFDEGKVKKYLEFVAQQANNITSDGKFNVNFDSRKSAKQIPSQIRDLANEIFPDFSRIADESDYEIANKKTEPIELSIEVPEGFEVPKPDIDAEVNIHPLNTKSDAIPIKETAEIFVGEPSRDSGEMESGISKPEIPTGKEEKSEITSRETEIDSGGSKEPPPISKSSVYVEEPSFRLIKSELQRVRSEMGLEDFEGEKVSDIEAITRAHRTIKDWKEKGIYEKEVNKIIEDANNEKISDEGQNILAQYIADLRVTAKRTKDRNSPEYDNVLAKLNKAVEAGDILRSAAGRVLGRNTLKMRGEKFDSVLDVELDMMKDYDVNELTPVQKAEAEARFNDLNSKFEKESELRKKAEEEITRLKEEVEILNSKKSATAKRKKTDAEYKQERSDLISSIKKKWSDAGKDILSSDIPYRKQLAAIAPDVGKLIANYIEQGVAKTVEEVRKVLKRDIEDAGINITEEDVRRLIAGEFNEKKTTRNELARNVYLLRTEEKLLLELEALERGEEPKSEKRKIERNKRLKELRDQIDAINKENKTGKYSNEEKFERTIKQRIKANRDKQKELEERIKNKDFSEPDKEPSILENKELQKKNKELYDEYLKSAVEKNAAIFDYEKKRLEDKIKNHSVVEKLGDWADIALSTTKGAVAMFDQSGVLVQMLGPTLSHPLVTVRNLPSALRDLVDNKWFDARMAKLKGSKLWDIIEKSELAIYDPKGIGEDVRNEILGGRKNLLNRDIVIGGKKFSIGKALERSTSNLFNNMRVYLFENRVNDLYSQGKTWETHPEEFKSVARAINEWTAHGKVEKHLAQASPVLNKVIWSPKMLASTFNVLGFGDLVRPVQTAKEIGKRLGIKGIKENNDATKGFYTSLTPKQRRFMAKEIVRAIGTVAMTMVAARLAGVSDDEDLNPLSIGFGDMYVGDKRINLFGRYGGAIKAISQASLGKRIIDGKVDVLGDKYTDKDEGDVIFGSFIRGKMTPMSGLLYDIKFNRGKNYFTKEEITPMTAAKQVVVPLSFQEMVKDMDRDGSLKGLLTTLFKIYGGNIKDRRDFEKARSSK